MKHRVRFFLMIAVALGLVPVALFACGQVTTTDGTTADASSATGTERGACYPNGTCNAGLVCLSQLCVSPPQDDAASGADVDIAVVDAGPPDTGNGGCGTIPTFPTGCFDGGHSVCPDGTCVDFIEAGCPPIIGFSGRFPMQCGRNADCKNNGYCCAGQDFAGPLSASGGNECLVDTTSNGASFYVQGSSCSASMCSSPICASDSDCRPGQHCAVMHLTDNPSGPAIGACIK